MQTGGGRSRPEPELSLEWKDLRIEIKYCGNDIPDEVQEFVELFPNISDQLISSTCIQEKKLEFKRRQNHEIPASRTAHTLTEVLEQNKMFNHKRRSDGDSDLVSPTPQDCAEEDDTKSQNSEDFELPDNIDQLIDVKKLITLEDGSKQCHICSKILSGMNGTRMKRHLLSHSDKKPFKCNLCGWGFHQKTNMERHLASHTNEGEGHPCSYCNSWFTTKSVVSLHMRQAHAEMVTTKTRYEEDDDYNPSASGSEVPRKILRPETTDTSVNETELSNLNLTCNICGKTFLKKTNLKHHLMLHRGEKPWKCHICGWRFVQKCNLKKHIDTHNTGTYQCPHCDVRFASKGSVSEHISTVHNQDNSIILNTDVVVKPEDDEEEAEIPAPDEGGKNNTKLESSAWKPAIKQPQQIQAGSITITPKTTINIPTVTHQRLEQALRTFQCPTCPKAFSSQSELGNHTLVHNAGMKPYACPVCGLRFHLLHNMKRHLVTHEESGDIEVGTASELLQAVEATATKVKLTITSFVCDKHHPLQVQPKSDPLSGVTVNAAGHMKCKFCNKWFTEQAALSKHMEVHSVNRPYACPICGWRFKQMHNMKRHLLTHSGAKPYSCDFCDKSYTDNYSLKQHVAKVHPDIASSLPHMMITPRTKSKVITPSKTDEEGFQSMVKEMTESQKAAALQAYQQSLSAQSNQEHLPFGVEAVTYAGEEEEDEDMDDAEMVDPTDFMEEGVLEIDEDMEDPSEDVTTEEQNAADENVDDDHIEIQQPPVTQEVIDEGGEGDDEKDKNSD